MEVLTPGSDDDESDGQNAARWRRYLQEARSRTREASGAGAIGDGLCSGVEAFVNAVGHDRLVALSPNYANGSRFDQLLGSILERVGQLAKGIGGGLDDLTQVTDDGSVRVLTIHKAKGLEFHTVIVLGVEAETFWSNDRAANRAEFFVAVTRAKKRLLLTVAEQRDKSSAAGRRDEIRSPHPEFLAYADLK